MSGTKPIASLGPLLLARKGTAKPAMRAAAAALHSDNDIAVVQAELGWNDMGDDETVPVVGTDPVVRRQQEELVTRIEDVRAARKRIARPAAKTAAHRSAFTLRLDAERHLKLKLASAVEGESAQQLITEALDRLLAEMPEIETLAAQITRNGNEA